MDEKTPLRPGASLIEICEYVQKFNHMPTFMSIDEYREKYVIPSLKMTSMNETLDRGMKEIVKLAQEMESQKASIQNKQKEV